MKRVFLKFLPILLLFFSMCDRTFLDETVTTDLELDVVFNDSTYTVGVLNEIYRQVGFDVDPGRFSQGNSSYGGLQTACDEAKFRILPVITTDVMFVTGTVNPVTVTGDAWNNCYTNIRRVNVFLANVDRSPLSRTYRETLKAEARFLRAWYYHILLRHYGGVPLIGDKVFTLDDDLNLPRNTFKEVVDYIVSECEALVPLLPAKPMGFNNGRAGSGACHALISRLRLYEASPFYNGSTWGADVSGFDKALVGYAAYDRERWKVAYEAAYRVMALQQYELYHSDNSHEEGEGHHYQPGFGYHAVQNSSNYGLQGCYIELIFEQKKPDGDYRWNLISPPTHRWQNPTPPNGGTPYQEIVDAFPMRDGTPYDRAVSDYDPYNDRDRRLFFAIAYDGMRMPFEDHGTWANIYTYVGHCSPDEIYVGTPTGYYINKFLSRWETAGSVHSSSQNQALMRYAEILLNYAEARNEYYGEADTPEGRNSVYQVLKDLRKRAETYPGADDMYGLKPNMNQAEMREAIQYERRIELCFEGHRFFDVRRWMIADVTESRQMTGMEITKHTDDTKTYRRIDVAKHSFNRASYLWPIPNIEVSRSPNLKQNPYY